MPGASFVQECNKPQPVLVVHVPCALQKPLRLTSSLVSAASLAQLSVRGLERKPDLATRLGMANTKPLIPRWGNISVLV